MTDSRLPLINLLKGAPNPHLLPASLLAQAASRVLSDPSIYPRALEYGPEQGYPPLRESLAGWLADFYQPRSPSSGPDATADAEDGRPPILPGISPNRLCITGGASQNLGIMMTLFTDPNYTGAIFLVAPAYFLAFRIFEDAGFEGRLRAVPEDDEGLDIAALRKKLEDEEARMVGRRKLTEGRSTKVYRHVIYCVPTFANPSGGTMTLRRRTELVRLAREFDALVVADDVYDFLQWSAQESVPYEAVDLPRPTGYLPTQAVLPRLVDVDRELDGGPRREGADGWGNVCSNGSFSKIAGPGLRVGWVEGEEKFVYTISQAGTTRSGGSPCQLTSTYMDQLLRHVHLLDGAKTAESFADGALQSFIRHTLLVMHVYRYRHLKTAIEKWLLPLGFTLPRENPSFVGGYFTWLRLPEGLDADALAQRCLRESNVVIASGSIFEVPGDESVKFRSNIRLCWAWEDDEKLGEGIERVAGVAGRMLEEGEGGEYVVVETGGQEVADFK